MSGVVLSVPGSRTERGQADPSALALSLRLTIKQRLFAEALARDTKRNQTLAARTAGCGKGAEVTASRWLRLAKVQRYIAALTEAARAAEDTRTVKVVADMREVLEMLSAQLRAKITDYLKPAAGGRWEVDYDSLQYAPPGVRVRTSRGGFSIEMPDQLLAAKLLLAYHGIRLSRRGRKRR